jgi:hypothetical protein
MFYTLRHKLKIYGSSLSPAFFALFIQLLALIILILLLFITISIDQYVNSKFLALNSLSLVFSLSGIALGLSIFFKVPVWWYAIHFFFPISVYAAYQLEIPWVWYFSCFLVCLGVFWSVFKTQVPFFPSTRWVSTELLQLISKDSSSKVIDIGSGLGRLPISLAQERPMSIVEGIEIAPFLWGMSCLLAFFRRSKVNFKLGNYRNLNFGDYDLVFAYLSPAAMPALWQKAASEMRDGTLLVSYEFKIPDVHPSFIISKGGDSPLLYAWKMNALNKQPQLDKSIN